MPIAHQSAKHLREAFVGGNWTVANVRDVLQDINWKQAVAKVESCNSIVALTYHIGYFVSALLQVMREGKLEAHDKFSFDHPPIECEEDWQKLKEKVLSEVEELAALLAVKSDDWLNENFVDAKYGTNFRNVHGLIEHTHYHLGQIAILKKFIH